MKRPIVLLALLLLLLIVRAILRSRTGSPASTPQDSSPFPTDRPADRESKSGDAAGAVVRDVSGQEQECWLSEEPSNVQQDRAAMLSRREDGVSLPLDSFQDKLDDQQPEARRRRAPADRGGRPREPEVSSAPPADNSAANERPARSSRLEVICWQETGQWVLGLEVATTVLSHALTVTQDDEPLCQDPMEESRWQLVRPTGRIALIASAGSPLDSFDLKPPLGFWAFKLGATMDRGRAVQRATSGWYLAIVPASWERDTVVAGDPPVDPESVTVSGYLAHYFVIGDDASSGFAFRTPDGPRRYPSEKPKFILRGNRIPDAADNVGPLFGGDPPVILATGGWSNVQLLVIGEEGPAPDTSAKRWRMSVPNQSDGDASLSLPGDQFPGDGWYFARFYDDQTNLVESLDFRYAPGLIGVEVPDTPPLPQDTAGHTTLTVTIRHRRGCSVEVDRKIAGQILLRCNDVLTKLDIPPTIQDGSVSVIFRSNPAEDRGFAKGVHLEIELNRIWWEVSPEHTEPSVWGDKVRTLYRSSLRADSREALWLRFPRAGWTRTVRVGFDRSRARTYLVRRSRRVVSVPLREFSGAAELAELRDEVPFHVWVRQTEEHTAVVAQVSPRFTCKLDACTFECADYASIVEHIRAAHPSVVRQLSYDELRVHRPDLNLPAVIYKCPYCRHYEQGDGKRDATGEMYNHIIGTHPGEMHGWRIVTDLAEIRRYVIAALPTE